MAIDMDIVNAAMVQQRSLSELAAAQAANAKKKPRTSSARTTSCTLMITQLKNQDPFKPVDPSNHSASSRSSARSPASRK